MPIDKTEKLIRLIYKKNTLIESNQLVQRNQLKKPKWSYNISKFNKYLTWREIGGSHIDQFALVPTLGSASGIIVGWNSSVLTSKVLSVGEFSLTIEFCSKQSLLLWICTTVYGLVVIAHKHGFWEKLGACVGPPVIPSIVCGDFNVIFALED